MTTRKRKKKSVGKRSLHTAKPTCEYRLPGTPNFCGNPGRYRHMGQWYCEGHFIPFPATGSREEPLATVKQSLTPRKPSPGIVHRTFGAETEPEKPAKSVGMKATTPFGLKEIRRICELNDKHPLASPGAVQLAKLVLVNLIPAEAEAAKIEEVRKLAKKWSKLTPMMHNVYDQGVRECGRDILAILDKGRKTGC